MASNFVRINGYPVAPAVARDYLRMKSEHDRVTGGNMSINSGYRPRSDQVAIFERRYRPNAYSPYGDYRTYQGITWGRIDPGGPAASPDANGGYGSNHTQGYALDFNLTPGTTSYVWLVQNASRYGFNHREGASINEAWHWGWHVNIFADATTPDPWEGRGRPDPVYSSDPGMSITDLDTTTGDGGITEPVNDASQEDDLRLFRINDPSSSRNMYKYAISPGHIECVTLDTMTMLQDAGYAKATQVREASFKAILRGNGIPEDVVRSDGYIRNDKTGGTEFIRYGSWSHSDKAERFAYLAQKK